MIKKDFEKNITLSGVVQYLHVENGKKRGQLLKDRMNGKITPQCFENEQKKMRTGKYLKYIYSEAEYNKEIGL